jgi:hypothetical protein
LKAPVFKTMCCAELWKLPSLPVQLLRGADSPRANLTRVCSNAARHVIDSSATSDLALAGDLLEVHKLMLAVSLEWLVMLPDERKAELIAMAEELAATEEYEIDLVGLPDRMQRRQPVCIRGLPSIWSRASRPMRRPGARAICVCTLRCACWRRKGIRIDLRPRKPSTESSG